MQAFLGALAPSRAHLVRTPLAGGPPAAAGPRAVPAAAAAPAAWLWRALGGAAAAALGAGGRPRRGRQAAAAGGSAASGRKLGASTPRANAVAMRSLAGPWHEPDGPDSFFDFQNAKKSRNGVIPGWNKRISPTGVNKFQKVVYFTPQSDKRNLEEDGFCKPKMWTKWRMPKWLKGKHKKAEKKTWRGMSKRVQGEFRFKRMPRDENGKVVAGTLNNGKPRHLLLQPGQYGKKKRPRIGP